MGNLPVETREYPASLIASIDELLQSFYTNVAAAFTGSSELVCPLEAGLDTVELANAIMLSSHLGREVNLPLCRAEYERFLDAKLSHSATQSLAQPPVGVRANASEYRQTL